MAEDPKRFLREVKAGIGEAKLSATDLCQLIEFEDAQHTPCRIECSNTEELRLTSGLGGICLTPGQAKRLANTLERWAIAGSLGHAT